MSRPVDAYSVNPHSREMMPTQLTKACVEIRGDLDTFSIDNHWFGNGWISPAVGQGEESVACEVEIRDKGGNGLDCRFHPLLDPSVG